MLQKVRSFLPVLPITFIRLLLEFGVKHNCTRQMPIVNIRSEYQICFSDTSILAFLLEKHMTCFTTLLTSSIENPPTKSACATPSTCGASLNEAMIDTYKNPSFWSCSWDLTVFDLDRDFNRCFGGCGKKRQYELPVPWSLHDFAYLRYTKEIINERKNWWTSWRLSKKKYYEVMMFPYPRKGGSTLQSYKTSTAFPVASNLPWGSLL